MHAVRLQSENKLTIKKNVQCLHIPYDAVLSGNGIKFGICNIINYTCARSYYDYNVCFCVRTVYNYSRMHQTNSLKTHKMLYCFSRSEICV